jgi:hypothetical protein
LHDLFVKHNPKFQAVLGGKKNPIETSLKKEFKSDWQQARRNFYVFAFKFDQAHTYKNPYTVIWYRGRDDSTPHAPFKIYALKALKFR